MTNRKTLVALTVASMSLHSEQTNYNRGNCGTANSEGPSPLGKRETNEHLVFKKDNVPGWYKLANGRRTHRPVRRTGRRSR